MNSYKSRAAEAVRDLDHHVGYWLRAVSNAVHRRFEAALNEHGVSVAQWVALRRLYEMDSVSLNEAAKLIGIDQSSASRLLERLVLKDLIKREVDPADRRAVKIRLSPAARKLVPVLAKAADENDQYFFDKLTGNDKRHLLATLKTLIARNKLSMSTDR